MSRMGSRPSPTGNSRRRFSPMANAKRASMREGPLAELFRKTEDEDGEPVASPPPEGRAAAERGSAADPAPPAHPRESGLPHPGLGASTDSPPEEPRRVATP